ncbi:MAG: ferritin-like domain-containing protein [Planctomycetales bacterium]
MELRDFADRVLFSESLAEKLRPPETPLTDDDPGPAERVAVPARPAELRFALPRTAPAMPGPEAFADPAKRAVAHHIMANHELQALEVMAFVLRAFPDAPREFRRGLAWIMADEQKHTRMHAERAAALGVRFGDLPVNCYIWKKALAFQSVLDYLAGLPLVFENRNLDHTLEFEERFRRAGDRRSAAVARTIHRDEIAHVAFGLEWLRKLKPAEQSDWEAWQAHLHWPLRPEKAAGAPFRAGPRRAAGMTEEFIARLEQIAGG